MKKYLLYILLCFLGVQNLYAQNKKAIDSLMRVHNTTKYDTTKILALTSIAFEYNRSKPDTCISIAEKALQMSEKIGFERGKAGAWNNMGVAKSNKKNYPEALTHHQKALAIFEKIQDKKGVGNSFHNIGIIYQMQDEYSLALGYYQKSLKIKEEIGDKQRMAASLNNIGLIYKNQGNFPLGLDYYQKSLKIEEEIGNKQGMAGSLNNIGVIHDEQENYPLALDYYQKSLKIKEALEDKTGVAASLNNIGGIYKIQANYPLALDYYQKSLKIREELGDKRGVSRSFNNIGNIYYIQGNYSLASEHYQKSLKLQEEVGDKRGKTYTLDGLAMIARKQGAYDKGIAYAQEALQIAREIKATTEVSALIETLYHTYKLKGDYAKALEYHELYKTTKDSLFNIEKSKKIANLEAQADIERKQKEIAILNKNQVVLEKDNQLQKAAKESERTERLAIEKQKEANELKALAKQEKDKRKQDSLYNVAQQRQLEADKFFAESKAQKLQIQQAKEAKEAQQRVLYVVLAGLAIAIALAYLAYRSRQAEKHAKEEIKAQNEEITIQAEQLETANKTKDQLFSIIAHDLRSPMMSFQGLNKQIKFFLAKDRPEKLEQLGENIEKASTRLNSLLDNLLQWAMLQKQVIRTNPENIDLQEAVAHCVSHFEGLAQSQQVTLYQEVGKEFITTDYNILQTILRNLLSNALKFTPEGGEIYLAYQREMFGGTPNKYQGILSVRDTGAGMSAEKVANLFQGIQFKSEQGLRGEKGTGLGLQLCYELAQQINATLQVESQEGKGTTFRLILPD